MASPIGESVFIIITPLSQFGLNGSYQRCAIFGVMTRARQCLGGIRPVSAPIAWVTRVVRRLFEFAMRVEIHGKLTADAVLSDEGLKHHGRLIVWPFLTLPPSPDYIAPHKKRVWCSLMDKLKIAKGMEPLLSAATAKSENSGLAPTQCRRRGY